jgi:hypothetical protein
MNIVANAFKMMFALNGFVRTKLSRNFWNSRMKMLAGHSKINVLMRRFQVSPPVLPRW